ncbi:hypothetical protein [Nocardioides mangrovicus]|uniref:hypothetical protein n=1 Tax=Nocardioides mangrovicus TaxID=2478913 RepID=UPI0013150002|nr:hypothetical protein [Nocardioides mangrovicus]
MKSAEVMIEGDNLFSRMRTALIELGDDETRASESAVNYFDDQNRMYTVFRVGYFDPWDPQDDGILVTADEQVRIPDLRAVDHLAVECRWEDLFANLTRQLAELLGETIWVIDGNDVLWDAARIDPDRILL